MKILYCLVAGCIALSAAAAEPVDELRCREIAFSVAAESRDAESFAALIDADARFVGQGVYRGPDEIVAAWAPFFAEDGPRIAWRPQFVEVLEDESLALTRGPYRVTSTDADGRETEHWGTFNSVWRRQADGSWKVVFDAGNAADEPPPEEIRALIENAERCEGT